MMMVLLSTHYVYLVSMNHLGFTTTQRGRSHDVHFTDAATDRGYVVAQG